MKLLFLVDSLPFPPTRGYLQMAYHQILELAKHHTIDLIAFPNRDTPGSSLGPLEQACRRIHVIPRPAGEALVNAARAAASGEPLTVGYFRSSQMARAVKDALADGDYDVVVVELSRMAQYLPRDNTVPAVLNLVDPFVISYGKSIRSRPLYQRPVIRAEMKRLAKFERKTLGRFARLLLIAKPDVSEYSRILGGLPVDWIPYGTDTNRFRPSDVAREPGMIVLSGNMFYRPNVEAVQYFVRDIFPRIKAAAPAAVLWLVGARPAKSIRALASDDVCVTGEVPDVMPYVQRAMVSVCPVTLAVGTQTKVLEAMAVGTPVVTTSAGNHGVGGVDGVHLRVADDPESFSAAVVDLLQRREWDSLSKQGREFVVERFSWPRTVSRFEAILQQVHEHR